MNLAPEQLHALAVAGKAAKKVRGELKAGQTYEIDALVQIKGKLQVGHPQPCTSSSSVPAPLLLATVLAQFGPRKRIAVIDQILEEIAANKGSVDVDNKALQQAERLIRETMTQTEGTKNGNVTGKIDVSLVQPVVVQGFAQQPAA